MDRCFNKTDDYCYGELGICDHNQIDSPVKMFICTGIGGKCENGNKYEFYIKKERTVYDRDGQPFKYLDP